MSFPLKNPTDLKGCSSMELIFIIIKNYNYYYHQKVSLIITIKITIIIK